MNDMYIKLKKNTLALCLTMTASVFFSFGTFAQERAEKEESEKGGHKITVAVGQTHIHENFAEKGKKWKIGSSLALNYDYLITDRWAIGLHNDVLLDDFSIEKMENGQMTRTIERERPVASKVVGSFTLLPHFVVNAGAGAEFEKSENFFLTTVGTGYEFAGRNGWGFGVELAYDVKWKAYDTWILGVGVSKTLFGKKHRG